MTLTTEAVLALAPDASSANNGKKLANLAKWQNLNAPEGVLWGECQGSGSKPYLTAIDLKGMVAKCSCPSRKFPCKHGLALMLLYAGHTGDFGTEEAPESIQKWLEGRKERVEKAVEKAEKASKKAADPVAQAKRREAREKKVTAGLSALHLFLKDLVRDGLAQASTRPYSDWDTQAARLVDSQAPGAARLVRLIPEYLRDPAALLKHLGMLAMLCEGWTNREHLSEGELLDLRLAIGFPLDQAALKAETGINARWNILGQAIDYDEQLTVRRIWLQNGDQTGLILDFAAMGRPLPPGMSIGQSIQTELCFAPCNYQQRAVIRSELGQYQALHQIGQPLTLDAMLEAHAGALSQSLWLERAAYLVGPVHLVPGEPWVAVDAEQKHLPLVGHERALLQLLAVGGGEQCLLFGEWDGLAFRPLSVSDGDQLIPLRQWREES